MARSLSIGKWKHLAIMAASVMALVAIACSSAPAAPAAQPQAPAPVAPAPAAPLAPAPQAPVQPQQPAPAAPAVAAPSAPIIAPTASTLQAAATARPIPQQAVQTSTEPRGKLTAVTFRLGSGSGWPTDCVWCATFPNIGAGEALVQASRDPATGAFIAAPWVAESWETAADLSYTDWKIREGIQFHLGWGELTAEDVAWTFNAANPAITPEAIHDTMPLPEVNRVEAIDARTARMYWNAFAGNTIMRLTDLGEGIPIHSKRVFDEMGADWMRQNIILSGPFEATEWTQQEVIRLVARTDGEHWNRMPYIEQVDILEVLEASTRRAMLETEQAQLAHIPISDWPNILNRPKFARAPEGNSQARGILFQGNYWETTHPRNGDALTREIPDSPWVGNPNDPASLERSKDVRVALSQCVDRVGILASILQGQGRLAYVQYIHPDDPVYAKFNGDERWKIPFDCEGSRQLLAKNGLQDGFSIDYWAGPSGVAVETAEAIAATWLNELNVQVDIDRQTYSTWRPTLISRTTNGIHGDFNPGNAPSTWPNEWTWSAVASPAGYNSGNELPKASETVIAKESTQEQDELERLTVEWVDYIYENRFGFTIGTMPNNSIYNTEWVEKWDMRPMTNFRLGGFKSLETMKLFENKGGN